MNTPQVLPARHQCLQSDGSVLLEAVEPKNTVACRMATAYEHEVLWPPLFSAVVYYQPITRQSDQTVRSWQRARGQYCIPAAPQPVGALKGALNFELLGLNGCRIHHRQQGPADRHARAHRGGNCFVLESFFGLQNTVQTPILLIVLYCTVVSVQIFSLFCIVV